MEQGALQYHLLKVFSELENRLANRIIERLSSSSIPSIGTPIVSENLLKDTELCDLLKISTAHFYKLKKKHKNFPVYDIGGAKRYKQSEVEDFFKSLKNN
jgi:predicted DNA-binding transcriptional regulator AlpA